ncbi:MAG: M20 family peptidase [Flavobacteriaceae bacterium]
MKRFLQSVLIAFLLLLLVMVYKSLNFPSQQLNVSGVALSKVDEAAIERFSGALQLKTISPEKEIEFDSIAFFQFNDYIKTTYPLVDALLEKKQFNHFSHLFYWQGSDPSLKPVILMGHLDVVPVIEENLTDWKQPPFGGKVVNDTLWGRGTIDDKIGVIGLLEATEGLLAKGHQPKRSLYLSFGHDEEIGGLRGAKAIVEHLEAQGVEAAFVLDEGGTISQGIIPGIKKDVALIGIAEKGYVSLELSVKKEGGHSSMPEKESAIDILSSAIVQLKTNPFPAKLAGPIANFIDFLGPEMPGLNRFVFANRWLFESIITGIYEKTASGNALVRTTTAPTLFNAGIKDNVIPQSAKATVNFRIMPGENSSTVLARVKELIQDPRIQISKGRMQSEPSHVSSIKSKGFKTLRQTVAEVYPEALVAPFLVIGGTDSKHFEPIAKDIYRFSPMIINRSNIKSFHGLNERIAVKDFKKAIQFYDQLIVNSTME